LQAVVKDKDSRIAWPNAEEMRAYSDIIKAHEPGISNVFGFVDGVYFRCDDPADSDTQNAYYNGWKSCCSITNVLVFAPDGTIIWACYNMPGSWHDAVLARHLFNKLLNPMETPSPYCLIADSAFPSTKELQDRIITPPKVNQIYENNYNSVRSNTATAAEVIKARQGVEWGMHSLQSAFARLGVPLPFDPPYTHCLLKLIFHLYNLRVRKVGLNQLRTVYCGPYCCE
jgi:hypothetical protein